MKSFSVVLVLLVALVASACGGADASSQTSQPSERPAITGAPAGFNADDLAFAKNVLASHTQSADLSALVPQRSTNSGLITFAADLSAGQASQLEMMKVFLVQWNENPDIETGQDGHGEAEKGNIDDATVSRLKALSGKDFDDLWLQSMLGHLQGAVVMAEAEVAHGSNVDAIATARQIVDKEGARIALMQQLLAHG